MPRGQQGMYWLLTIPEGNFVVPDQLPSDLQWIRGQKEIGESTGYPHWQIFVQFKRKVRLGGVKAKFGATCHAELSRSTSAEEYVWKEDTRVPNTQFEVRLL